MIGRTTSVTSEQRLKRLLSHGYFPDELPPAFTSERFSQFAQEFRKLWAGEQIRKFRTRPESYNIPRYSEARRKLAVVNPVNQLHVSDLISENWKIIEDRLNRSRTSEFSSVMDFTSNKRSIRGVDFDAVDQRKAQLYAVYGRCIRTDISRFYASIYTHSIPWALLGKIHCKQNLKSQTFRKLFPNLLDVAVQAGQEGQTIGIPIGPDTSRILSELIAVEIEEEARALISQWDDRTVRYVDDVIIGLGETESQAPVLSNLSLALSHFELELNAEKTRVIGVGRPHAQEWLHYLRTFRLREGEARERADIGSFFEQAIYLSDANPSDNVLLYATVRAASFQIRPENVKHLVRWMIYITRRSASCVRALTRYLISLDIQGPLKDEVENFVKQQIALKAHAAHTHEVAWLLYLARERDLHIEANVLADVVKLPSSIAGLLVLDIIRRGKVKGTLDISFWRSFANEDGLKSEMWMIAYEATKRQWWGRSIDQKYVEDNMFFASILHREVEFYDTSYALMSVEIPETSIVSKVNFTGSIDYS